MLLRRKSLEVLYQHMFHSKSEEAAPSFLQLYTQHDRTHKLSVSVVLRKIR